MLLIDRVLKRTSASQLCRSPEPTRSRGGAGALAAPAPSAPRAAPAARRSQTVKTCRLTGLERRRHNNVTIVTVKTIIFGSFVISHGVLISVLTQSPNANSRRGGQTLFGALSCGLGMQNALAKPTMLGSDITKDVFGGQFLPASPPKNTNSPTDVHLSPPLIGKREQSNVSKRCGGGPVLTHYPRSYPPLFGGNLTRLCCRRRCLPGMWEAICYIFLR